MTINELIIETALSYVGQKEIPNNLGFEDKNFEQEMKSEGWMPRYAWCAISAKLMWKKAYTKYKPEILPELDELFSIAATKTFNNFKKFGWRVDRIAEQGSLIIWQHYEDGKKTWKGHAGIVKMLSNEFIHTIEGNTNGEGSRNGDQYMEKIRKYNFEPVKNGLVLMGFIHPKS